jgi:hypothetical protein
LSSIPIDLVGKGFFSPSEGRFHRRDSLNALPNHEGRTGDGSSLFSLGLGGRWVPLRGPVSPYLGLSFLVSHQEGGVFGRDSSETVDAGESNLPDRLDHGGKGVTRFGAEVSVGSEFVLSTLIRLDVGASYSFNSPFDRGRNLSAIGFGASVLFTLF